MNKILNIFLITLAILKLGQEAAAASVTVRPKYNFDITFVKNMIDYLKNNTIDYNNIKGLDYDKKKGFTLGKIWDSGLFSLALNLDDFRNSSFTYSTTYTYPKDEIVDIQYLELYYENSTDDGLVFMKAGGIGQSFVSLVAEVGDTKDKSLKCHINVFGDTYDVIN